MSFWIRTSRPLTASRPSSPPARPDAYLPPRLNTWNGQITSPLYAALPPEIRHLIFQFVLLPYQDTSRIGVPFDSHGYRPETAFPKVQSVELLRTCRRVYLETYALPASLRTFVTWTLVWPARCPNGRSTGPRFHAIRTEDQHNVQKLRIYAQQCGLENHSTWSQRALDLVVPSTPNAGINIRELTICIRYTDFYFWENDATLEMSDTTRYGAEWRRGFSLFPNLETFAFELEMIERRKKELDGLINDVKRWRIALPDGRELTTDGQSVKQHTWMGSTQFSGKVPAPPGTTQQTYHVATILFVTGAKA